MAALGSGYTIRHQAGKGSQQEVSALYQQHQVDSAEVTEFIDDVSEAYQWADLIVCRSGALTVSELAAVGVGAIFIPFMHKDRQQALNGDHLVDCKAAYMIEQPELTVEKLTEQIRTLDRAQLKDLAINARGAAKLDADTRVANEIIELTK